MTYKTQNRCATLLVGWAKLSGGGVNSDICLILYWIPIIIIILNPKPSPENNSLSKKRFRAEPYVDDPRFVEKKIFFLFQIFECLWLQLTEQFLILFNWLFKSVFFNSWSVLMKFSVFGVAFERSCTLVKLNYNRQIHT